MVGRVVAVLQYSAEKSTTQHSTAQHSMLGEGSPPRQIGKPHFYLRITYACHPAVLDIGPLEVAGPHAQYSTREQVR